MTAGSASLQRLRLDLTGALQGVGFRPFVYRLATSQELSGFVCNTGDGAAIEIEGGAPAVEGFVRRLEAELPPHAAVDRCRVTVLAPKDDRSFVIASSVEADTSSAVVMADLAICPDCL